MLLRILHLSLSNVLKNRGYTAGMLFVALAGTIFRMLAIPPLVSDLDSVNFARALDSYDLLNQSPHFPGYPVYLAFSKIFRMLGVVSDSFALALPGILTWPAAVIVFYTGLKNILKPLPTLGALTLASLAPAAVLTGGNPGSDGLGLSLILCASGFAGLGTKPTGQLRQKLWTVASGIFLGLTLGVRLSWFPLVGSFSLLFLVRFRSNRALFVMAILLGVLSWAVPLSLLTGPLDLFRLALGFTGGHLFDWGGTAAARTSPDGNMFIVLCQRLFRTVWTLATMGYGSSWPGGIPFTKVTGYWTYSGAILAGLTTIGLSSFAVSCAKKLRNKDPLFKRRLLDFLVLLIPYMIWLIGFQNVAKARHLVVLLPLSGYVLFTGMSKAPLGRIMALAFTLFLMIPALSSAKIQRSQFSAQTAFVDWTTRHRSPEKLQIFAGEEARIFGHHAPMYRVARAKDPRIIEQEALRLSKQDVEVWMTSSAVKTPDTIQGMTPMKEFRYPAEVHPQAHKLTIYRFNKPERTR